MFTKRKTNIQLTRNNRHWNLVIWNFTLIQQPGNPGKPPEAASNPLPWGGREGNNQHIYGDSERISHLQKTSRACTGVRIIITKTPIFSAPRHKLISRWHPKELSHSGRIQSIINKGMESLWHKFHRQGSPSNNKWRFLLPKAWL